MIPNSYLHRLCELQTGRTAPKNEFEHQALLNAVIAAVPTISGDFEREVFVLRYIHCLPWDKIADKLCGSTADNVTKRCKNAVEKARSINRCKRKN